MTITTKMIMSWGPCAKYTRAKISKLIGKGKTPQEICDNTVIPAADTLWVLLHEDIIPAKELHELACTFAERALKRERKAGREPDKRSWDAIKAKRLWLNGKITDEELAAAWDAEWDVARDVAWDAARDAARDAAWDVAWDAAWDAAGDVARAAAWDVAWDVARAAARAAAWDAAWDAEQKAQLKLVRKVLEKTHDTGRR